MANKGTIEKYDKVVVVKGKSPDLDSYLKMDIGGEKGWSFSTTPFYQDALHLRNNASEQEINAVIESAKRYSSDFQSVEFVICTIKAK